MSACSNWHHCTYILHIYIRAPTDFPRKCTVDMKIFPDTLRKLICVLPCWLALILIIFVPNPVHNMAPIICRLQDSIKSIKKRLYFDPTISFAVFHLHSSSTQTDLFLKTWQFECIPHQTLNTLSPTLFTDSCFSSDTQSPDILSTLATGSTSDGNEWLLFLEFVTSLLISNHVWTILILFYYND